MGPEIFHDAYYRLKFKYLYEFQLTLPTPEELFKNLCIQYHRSRTRALYLQKPKKRGKWTEAALIEMASFHWTVHCMSKRLFRHTTSHHPITRRIQKDVKRLSKTESIRITRALYRFELSCLLLKRKRPFDSWDASEMTEDCFFNGYPPWELEEVVCIRDFLNKCYLKFISEIEELRKRLPRTKDAEILAQVCLSGGLTDARSLVHCRSTRAKYNWCKSLRRKMARNRLRLENNMRFDSIVCELNRRGVRSGAFDRYRNRLTGPITNQYRAPIFFKSEEIGPNDAFTKTWSQSRMCEAKFADMGAEQLRRWGYVMWDRCRLEQWGLSPGDYSFRRVAYDEWLNI
jgi:hypothetical protein